MSDDKARKMTLGEMFKIPCPQDLDPKQTIVVVEDQQDLRIIVSSHLNKMGFNNVNQFNNGYDALEFIRESGRKISVIICDIEMPIMGGYDLLNELRENPDYERPPFALAMDHPSKEKIMFALENGVDEIVVKPFTLNDLFPKVQLAFRQFHNPKNPEKVYELAKGLYRSEKYAEAEKVYQLIAADNKNSARPIVGNSRIKMKTGKNDEALKLLEEAEVRNPNYVHLFSTRGKILLAQGKTDEAVAAFKTAIKLSPLNPLRYEEAVKPMYELKQYEEGIEILNIALENELTFPLLHNYLSQGYFALKEYKKAIKHIRSALGKEPHNVTFLNQLGICQKESGDNDGAMSTYNSIIKIDPENLAAPYNKAILLSAMGKTADAIKTLTRLVEKAPNFQAGKTKLQELKGAA